MEKQELLCTVKSKIRGKMGALQIWMSPYYLASPRYGKTAQKILSVRDM